MKKISRRTFLSAVAAMGAAGALTACGGSSASSGSAAASSSAASAVTGSTEYENVINLPIDRPDDENYGRFHTRMRKLRLSVSIWTVKPSKKSVIRKTVYLE